MTARGFDPRQLTDRLRTTGFVATHAGLQEMGVSTSTITRRIGPGGPWQRLAPGVVLGHLGTPTRHELLLGAMAFCGEDTVVTGLDALRAARLRTSAGNPEVNVLVPIARQRKSYGYIRVERTRRLPEPTVVQGIPFAPVPRALVDACRRMESPAEVRHLVADTVQQRLCSVDELRDQVRASARARTALARAALAEVADGVRSGAEAAARSALDRFGAPAPLWNVRLLSRDGVAFLSPDAYWPEFAAAMEIDSFAWHLGPDDYLRTLQRSRRLTVRGVLVTHFAPVEITRDPERFAREVMTFLHMARNRAMPDGIVVAA
jgi:hypothetical protein